MTESPVCQIVPSAALSEIFVRGRNYVTAYYWNQREPRNSQFSHYSYSLIHHCIYLHIHNAFHKHLPTVAGSGSGGVWVVAVNHVSPSLTVVCQGNPCSKALPQSCCCCGGGASPSEEADSTPNQISFSNAYDQQATGMSGLVVIFWSC